MQEEKPANRKYRNLCKKIIVCFLLAVILVCIWELAGYYLEGYKSRKYSDYLRQQANIMEREQEPGQEQNKDGEQYETSNLTLTEVGQTTSLKIDFEELQKISRDVVAWIYIPGTEINYVIAQTDNNSYYLDSRLDGEHSAEGTLFMDYQNAPDLSDWNTLIYGHHMKNGTMFGSLKNYKEQKYYESHPVIYLYTPEQNYKVELLAAYTTNIDDCIYTIPGTREERDNIVSHAHEMSDFTSMALVDNEDRLVTFSTCAYDFDNARYVVLGKVVKE